MATKPLYMVLANTINALRNCQEKGNAEWADRHEDRIARLVREHLPSGSGFDRGCTLDLESEPKLRTGEKIKISAPFHHMDENGYYDGWTEHTITVIPDLRYGFDLRIKGKNRDNIHDLIGEMFSHILSTEIEEHEPA